MRNSTNVLQITDQDINDYFSSDKAFKITILRPTRQALYVGIFFFEHLIMGVIHQIHAANMNRHDPSSTSTT